MNDEFYVAIVGGGPAGLSAGLILGRCQRRTIIFDNGQYRNAASTALYGFLSRDGTEPAELRRVAREQLERYSTVELRAATVTGAHPRHGGGFELTIGDTNVVRSRLLLLATGLTDDLPPIPGAAALYGQGVFHCPYCDAHEVAQKSLVAYGNGTSGAHLALELRGWSHNVTLCTDGPAMLTGDEHARLRNNDIEVREQPLRGLHGNTRLTHIIFDDNSVHACDALFFVSAQRQSSPLAANLGCQFDADGSVSIGEYETTTVPGLYVAGDSSRLARLSIIAAAEGAQAAAAINTALLHADLA